MKWIKLIWIVSSVMLLAATPLAAVAAPQQQGTNLLQNPGFEGAYSTWGGIPQLQMPAGWTPWWAENDGTVPEWANHRPEWKPAEAEYYPTRVHSGERAIQWFKSYATFWAGAYQQVTVPANAPLRFSAYGFAWSCDDWNLCPDATSHNPANMRMRIGIDPTGGTNPWSGNIVWSGFASPTGGWYPFQVEATAQGSVVTVFLYSNPDWPKQNQDAYYDDASLVVIGAAPPAPAPTQSAGENPPPAAPAPVTSYATATPMPDGSIIHTVQAGETEWGIAARYGLTLDELRALNDIGAFIYEGQQLLIRPATQEEPTPEPTAEPTEEPTAEPTAEAMGGGEQPEPTAEPTEVAAVSEHGTICVSAYEDANANGVRDAGEGLLPGIVFAVANETQELGRYTTDGASEPYCFQGLGAGSYRVVQQDTAGWTPTTLAAWGVALSPGDLENMEFGNAAAPVETADTTSGQAVEADVSDTGEANSSTRTILFTGLGVFGLLLIMGAGVFVVLSRRNA